MSRWRGLTPLWILFVYVTAALAMHNRTQKHESLEEYRQRMGINFKYAPKLLHPEFCRFLSEEECQRRDEKEEEMARSNRRFLTSKGREQIRRALQETIHPQRTDLSNTGTLNVLVCLMVFTDHEGQRELPDPQNFDRLMNADDTDPILYPSGSVKTYFETISYGEFSIRATIADWVVTDNTEAFYAGVNKGRNQDFPNSFEPVLEALDAGGLDFTQFDNDGDGIMDLTVFLHSGYDALFEVDDCLTGAPPEDRIAAHALSTSLRWFSSRDFIILGTVSVASGLSGFCGSDIAQIGVIAHEMMHPFGLPDLYDFLGGLGNLGGIGGYGIMSSTSGQGRT